MAEEVAFGGSKKKKSRQQQKSLLLLFSQKLCEDGPLLWRRRKRRTNFQLLVRPLLYPLLQQQRQQQQLFPPPGLSSGLGHLSRGPRGRPDCFSVKYVCGGGGGGGGACAMKGLPCWVWAGRGGQGRGLLAPPESSSKDVEDKKLFTTHDLLLKI